MKNVRFYLEHETPKDRRAGKHSGNVFAAFVGNGWHWQGAACMVEGMGAVYDWPNSAVASTAARDEFLRKNCKRISEAQAREVHPALFSRLDEPND